MFDAFCLGVALTVGQGVPTAPMPMPPSTAGQVTVGDDAPRRIPAALPMVAVPPPPEVNPGRVPGVWVATQQKDSSSPPAKDQPPGSTAIQQKEAEKKDEEKKDEEKKEPEKGHLMAALEGTSLGCWLDCNKIKVYGFTEASYTHDNRGRINWPMLFQSPTQEFLLNQNWLTIEKPVDTDAKCPTSGFRIDAVIPGSDARFIHQRDLFDNQHGRYQWDVYQAYCEYYDPNIAKGFDLKIGKFAVPYMAEVTPANLNPLFSHSYAYYYNPFTHTGIWPTLTLDDNWQVGVIAALGNDVFFGPAANGMVVGIVQWTSTDKNDTVLLCVGISSGKFDVRENFSNQDHVDVVYTHKFDEKFKYIMDAGIGWEKDVPGIADTSWSWMVNYLVFDATDTTSYACRFEMFHDAEGFKTGFEGLYLAATAGVTFKPMPSVMFRPELRYDYNTETKPFGGQHGMCSIAADFIVQW